MRLKIIKERLRDEIIASKMKVTEIAKKLGVSHQTVSKYKNMEKLPSLETFSKLCEVIGSDANYILGITN
ncbi:MAG: helix-turn-helix domain-containing protein [Candidatus Onthoplasma sp.]